MADMTLEEALAAATVDEELVTPVNEVLLINPETRSIHVPDSEKLFGVRQDMSVERKYFKCPRIVGDNIDLSEHRIFINYVPSKQDGTYDLKEDVQGYWCKDLAVEGDFVTFSWKLSENVTRNAGYIAFAVYAKTIDEYGNLQTKWHTTIAIGNVLDTLPDGEEWTTVYPDIVMQLLERMDEVEKIATPESMQGYVDDYFNRNPMMIDRELKDATKAAPADIVGKLSEEIEEQKEVPMASINPYKMNLKNYDVVINEGRYVTGYSTTTLKPTMTQNNTYDYDVIDMPIKHDNCILTVPYDSMQSVGQAFVLYTEGIQANNATPNHVNNKQVGVIEVSTDSYTVNLNRSGLNYERVAFTVPKGRRDFYFQNPDEGEVGKIVDKKISDNFIIAPVNMFYSIGAIGDSYTAGSALSSDGVTWQDVTDLSWIATMAKRAGIYYSNYGKGGATTESYITDKLPSVLSGQAKDLYFICLGINDYMQNISVGAISDIKNDYTQNGKTFYGYYGSIIAQVQAHAPKSKIVLVKIWTDGTSKIPYDNAITEIASHFGLPTIDPFDDIYFNSSLYLDNMVSGHPTAMGYSCMGLAMERLFSKCVIENSAYFKFATIG